MNDPYVKGKRAREDNKPLKENPFEDGTADHTLWRAGWREVDIIEAKNKKAA